MRQLFILMIFGSLLLTCDDGDIVDVTLDFEQELDRCTLVDNSGTESFFLYDINTDTNESLSLLFPVSGNRDIFNPELIGDIKTLTINGSTIRFNYRTYNGDPENLICEIVPDPGTVIINDYEAAAGAIATFTSIFEDDDNDGIPSEFEARGELKDGEYPDARDTDGDGLPDYQDADDDGDNVLTINEEVKVTDDGDFTGTEDTDGDTIPNYLDNDDDGDEVLTKDEDENDNLSPSDDFDELDGMLDVPRYLDSTARDIFPQDETKFTQYTRSVTVGVVINNANIEVLRTDEIILGTFEFSITLPEKDDEN